MTPKEVLLEAVRRGEALKNAVAEDEMENNMGKKTGSKDGGSGEGSGEGGGETLEQHLKRFHKGVAPAEPCKWMIEHGYGERGAQEGATPKKDGNPDKAQAAAPVTEGGTSQKTETIEQPDGELKRTLGAVEVKTQKGAENVAKIEQMLQQADTPEKKEGIKNVYRNLQKAVKGNGGQSPEEIAKIKAEVQAENAEEARKEANAKRAADFKKRQKKEFQLDYKDAFNDAERAYKNGRMTRQEADKIQRIAEKTFFQRMDELEAMSDDEVADILISKVREALDNPYKPKAHTNITPARKKFQESLQKSIQSGTEKAKQTFAQRFKGSVDRFKQEYNKAYREYQARQSDKAASPQRSTLQKVLTGLNDKMKNIGKQTAYTDLVKKAKDRAGNTAASSPYEERLNKIIDNFGGDVDAAGRAIAKGGAKAAESGKVSNDGLRQQFGGIKAKSPMIQSMIDELENDFANAKTRKEKIALIDEFMTLQKKIGSDEYTPSTTNAGKSGGQDAPTGLEKIDALTDYEKKMFTKAEEAYKKAIEAGDKARSDAILEWHSQLKKSKAGLEGFDETNE